MNRVIAFYQGLPRSGRWLVAALVVMVGYFGVVEPVLDLTAQQNESADRAAAALARDRELQQELANLSNPQAAARSSFGAPLLPGFESTRKQALYARLNEIFARHGVTTRTSERTAALRIDKLASIVNASDRVDRFIIDVSFEASPETVTTIIGELEKAPEVTAVSKVSLRKSDARVGAGKATARLVKATVSPETWVVLPPMGVTASNGEAR